MYVHRIAKYFEMAEFWFLTGEYFFRSLVLKYSMWSTFCTHCAVLPKNAWEDLDIDLNHEASMIVLFFLSAIPFYCGL